MAFSKIEKDYFLISSNMLHETYEKYFRKTSFKNTSSDVPTQEEYFEVTGVNIGQVNKIGI